MNEIIKHKGKYYIGDPILALPDKYYIGIWGNEYSYQNGKFNINGFDMIIHSTHNGDGIYKDTRDRLYKIDSGTIGIIPIELLDESNFQNNQYSHIFEFTENINFIYDAGLIYIKSGKKFISIDTRNMDEYNSDFENHCENDNGEPITLTIEDDSDDDFIEECNNSINDNQLFESIPIPVTKSYFFKQK